MRKYLSLLSFLLCSAALNAQTFYEGTATFRNYGQVDYNWMVQFLPYNPVIVQGGAYRGEQSIYAAKIWPYGRIYAFEPNPKAYNQLQKAIWEAKLENVRCYPLALHKEQKFAALYISRTSEAESCMLPPLAELAAPNEEIAMVPCISLDEWCAQNQIDHVDVLSLELGGLELEALQASLQTLKSVKLLIVETFFQPYRNGTVNYFYLKDFLTKANFVPLAHWYEQGGKGKAVYVSQEMYDAYFIRCLGLGLGGLLYP